MTIEEIAARHKRMPFEDGTGYCVECAEFGTGNGYWPCDAIIALRLAGELGRAAMSIAKWVDDDIKAKYLDLSFLDSPEVLALLKGEQQ